MGDVMAFPGGLDARQREVLARVEAGADCELCGDMGAVDGSGRSVACMGCGRPGGDWSGPCPVARRALTEENSSE